MREGDAWWIGGFRFQEGPCYRCLEPAGPGGIAESKSQMANGGGCEKAFLQTQRNLICLLNVLKVKDASGIRLTMAPAQWLLSFPLVARETKDSTSRGL